MEEIISIADFDQSNAYVYWNPKELRTPYNLI